MDGKLSKAIAERLLKALSAEDVQAVVEDADFSYYFDSPNNWRPYGDQVKNWPTVGSQQSYAVGALVELITNSVDAILMRKAKERGIVDMRAKDTPQSMFEAVKLFFPHVVEGRIANLSRKQRTELAEQCVIIGIKRTHRKNDIYPTYTVIDSGEGQLPEDFPKTLLSLGERNKEGIAFVQGKYNMGSTGTLRYCTRSDIDKGHYKFLVSKRPSSKYWGWTLIRVRKAREGEVFPVAEYFFPGGQIPYFCAETLSALNSPHIGQISEGTVVKLYEFDVGPNARSVDFGLSNALTVNLIDCALPIRIYDFDAKQQENKGDLRKHGIAARTFSGMNVALWPESKDSDEEDSSTGAGDAEWQQAILEENHPKLGQIKIFATGVKNLKGSLKTQRARIFYTVNGQTHAIERASFLNRVGLGELQDHLIVNVICDKMDKNALANIFMPDRERKVNNNQSHELEDIVAQAMKGDEKLRAYASEIRLRRAAEYTEDKKESRELWEDLVKADPEIQNLFGMGTKISAPAKAPGGTIKYVGKKFPTFLNPLQLRQENGLFVKDVPINSYRHIHCGTDVENEYLSRLDSPGTTHCSLSAEEMPHSVKLHNGTATFTVKVPLNTKVGDKKLVEFGFKDNGRNIEPLKFSVEVRYVSEEATSSAKRGKETDTVEKDKDSLAWPQFVWVGEAEYDEYSFNENSGASVITGDEGNVVYVNRDHRSLRLMRMREKDEAKYQIYETMFKIGLGVFALSAHRKATPTPNVDTQEASQIDTEDAVRITTEAVAPYIVTIIKHLGGTS